MIMDEMANTTESYTESDTRRPARSGAPSLCIVVPCYNEELVLPETMPLFLGKLESLIAKGAVHAGSSVLYVDDGSSDSTWEIIAKASVEDERVEGLKLSRNFGHQRALLAGLMEVRSRYDVVVSIDCDGQDDINAIDGMLEQYGDGCDVVYGVRSDRSSDTGFKRFTAESFYKFLNAMGVEAVFNHADYRLMSSRALESLSDFDEVNLFLRGLVPMVGYRSGTVEYERHERIAGESHYPLRKMLSLALDGVTSLSIKPIHMISVMGVVMSVVSFIGIIWVLCVTLAGANVPGWASTVAPIFLVGGLQLLALGIIGEYIGRIYLESKHRPRYIIERSTLRDLDR